jgi:hypothetical protein
VIRKARWRKSCNLYNQNCAKKEILVFLDKDFSMYKASLLKFQ